MLETILTAVIASGLTTFSGLFVAKKRFEREQRLHFQIEAVVYRLLQHKKWRLRTFKTIRQHIGSFEDDKLRKVPLQAGALRSEDSEGVEVWGLIERNREMLDA